MQAVTPHVACGLGLLRDLGFLGPAGKSITIVLTSPQHRILPPFSKNIMTFEYLNPNMP